LVTPVKKYPVMSKGVIQQSTVEQAAAKPHGNPTAAKSWLRAIELTSRIEASPRRLFADIVEDWALRQPDRAALVSDAETLSYAALTERINRYARWALSSGIGPGDTVCLLMRSSPDYIAAWLGISKVGGVVALINTRLVGPSLAHCIDVAAADHVILGHDVAASFEDVRSRLRTVPKIWLHGAGAGGEDIGPWLEQLDGGSLTTTERRGVTIDHRALLIYTSGTTGLPKAASVSHRRILNWGGWFAGLAAATPEDRLFDCLPLFHSTGGVVAPCSMLTAGGSVALWDKFSVTSFWRDIVRHDCTVFQYIGELCRYLLKAPVSEFERRHRLRLVCGNGLSGEIWEAFQRRFSIPRILEFYASTEGNFSLYNVEGRPGSVGRIPPFLAHRFPTAIVRVDAELRAPVRNGDGHCVTCARGETGEAIGRIGTADHGGGRFEGYTDAAETEKKILRDVFAAGDAWFRTGDLMMQDEAGFFHFVDRIGDTFRWKGENVATSEVNQVVLDCPGIREAAIYGVEVAGADGRAGMAAIVIDDRFDLGQFRNHLVRRLPPYACPVFVRICAALDTTETFKRKKQNLIDAGYDPDRVNDPLFLWDPESGDLIPIDADRHARILDGTIRL